MPLRYAIPLVVVLLAMIAATLRGGKSNENLRPFLGKWRGEFAVQQAGGKTGAEAKRYNLRGYLQVYATKRRFQMRLEGEQQGVDITGTWEAKDNSLTLTPKDVQIDDRGGEELRDPNKVYIPAEEIRAAYSRPVPLRMDAQKRNLQGPLSSIGQDRLGRHTFEKDSP